MEDKDIKNIEVNEPEIVEDIIHNLQMVLRIFEIDLTSLEVIKIYKTVKKVEELGSKFSMEHVKEIQNDIRNNFPEANTRKTKFQQKMDALMRQAKK
ncbi:hypothetical protein EZY14_016410 [Kordia sp. TARA_039_SRF]|nr:hypothetical protein EZY14_016410 [Kordia sp. TARA_039_SRF]